MRRNKNTKGNELKMDCTKNEQDIRRAQEVKWFLIYLFLLMGLFAFFMKANSIISYADEVTLANQPYNVGGNSNGGESFVIDIVSDRDESIDQEQASNNVNVNDASNESNISDSDISSESDGTNIIFADERIKPGNENDNNGDGQNIAGDKEGRVTATNGDEIYVPDSDDDCPVSNLVPLDVEVQEYIWNHCKKVTGDYKNYYAFILGAIQLESEFKRTAIHHNKNGSTDRGLMQINSCNIKECKRAGLISCTDDLWDIYKNIDCGFHEMNEYVKKFGVCESAYYAYNTGRTKGGSNKNSRVVMSNMARWNAILFS